MLHINTFLHDGWKVLEEQVMRIEVVLVDDQVSNYSFHGPRLLVSYCCIESITIAILSFFNFALANFILEEDGVFIAEKRLVVVTKKHLHGSRIEAHDGGHISSIQLQKGLIKEGWLRLSLDQFHNISHCFTHVNTLKHHQLSQGDCMNLYFIQVFEYCFIVFMFIVVDLLDLNFSFFHFLICKNK